MLTTRTAAFALLAASALAGTPVAAAPGDTVPTIAPGGGAETLPTGTNATGNRRERAAAFTLLSTSALAGTPAAAPGDTKLITTLGGGTETPPTGVVATGNFTGRINPATGQLCYTLTSKNLDTLTMAHIHAGAIGVAGPPVVVLTPDVPTETCMAVDKTIAAKLAASPGNYYVNIHTAKFPKGASRGQLGN